MYDKKSCKSSGIGNRVKLIGRHSYIPIGLYLWGETQTTMDLREGEYISLPMAGVLTMKIAHDRTIMQRH